MRSAEWGKQTGGNGLIRFYAFQNRAVVSLLTGRRLARPYGLTGGLFGQCGENTLLRHAGEKIRLPGKTNIIVNAGDQLIIKTPGGGRGGEPR